KVKANYRATGELAATSSSVQGLAVIQKHYTPGEVGPIAVLLESPVDWESPRGRRVLEHLTGGFGYLDNVAEFRTLTQPLGPTPVADSSSIRNPQSAIRNPLAGFLKFDPADVSVLRMIRDGIAEKANQAAREFYQAKITTPEGDRYVTRLDV